jgi:hypothetical protein
MISINSLSGGKTSSYLAKHYKADYNVFALVKIEAEYCKPKDPSIIRFVSDKIGEDFIATAESDKTLYVVRDLEQVIGQEISWVSGDTFDALCLRKKAIPNLAQRFCTSELKMAPIAQWWYNKIGEKIEMRVGFRYDEEERASRFTTEAKVIVGKSDNGRRKWKSFEWRQGCFPLIEDKVNHFDVVKWANETALDFPKDSNCVGCFWKGVQQLRKNWDDEPQKMRWFSELEQKMKRRFKKDISYENVKRVNLQADFIFGTGSGCGAGHCTD